VGKTLVACALVRALRAAGHDVGVMKPAETGVGPEGPLDARALRAAAGVGDALEEICPIRLPLAAAPEVAAAQEGASIDPARIQKAYEVLAGRHPRMVVEGAGGLLVPLAPGLTMAELAGQLGLPVVLVARAALGTINHTLLSLEALETRGLPLAGVVISHGGGVLGDADSQNLAALRSLLGGRLVGEIPLLAPGQRPAAGALALA